MATSDEVYDQISHACYGFSREIIKREIRGVMYGSEPSDPWLRHIVVGELERIAREYLLLQPVGGQQ